MNKEQDNREEETFLTFEDIFSERKRKMKEREMTNDILNDIHDQTIFSVVRLALKRMESEQGSPPAHFTFILMGSGGRFEQSIWSDQDHGIVYEEDSTENSDYFLQLGELIVKGMEICGYEKCEGKVMSNNKMWCRSTTEWKEQIEEWLDTADWNTIRHFQIFFDSRTIYGEDELLLSLKKYACEIIDNNPLLYKRFVENLQHHKKGMNILGHLLPETTGENRGSIDFKELVLFPYVSSARLLAFLHHFLEPNTVSRFKSKELNNSGSYSKYAKSFEEALEFRIKKKETSTLYENVHFIPVNELSSEEKKKIKQWIREGSKLFKEASVKVSQRAKEGNVT